MMSRNSYEDNYESDFSQSTRESKNDSDFKLQLFKILHDKGIVDKLKSQVRQNLILEISSKESIANTNLANGAKKPTDIDVYYHSCFSILAGFLNDSNLTYTLSVLIPEINISKDKIYTSYEILRILGIDMESEFYKNIESYVTKYNGSLLWALLKAITDSHGSNRREIHIQTEKSEKFVPISEKIDKVDMEFAARQKEGMLKSQNVFEERIASYRRELDKRMKLEMDNEIEKFKSHEISILKIKEEERFSNLLKKKIKDLEDEYQHKIHNLKDRERQSQENVLKLKESQERENYLQRQQILRDLNSLQQRELENKKERDRNEREIDMMKEQHKMKLDKLEAKESKLRELELGMEYKIREEVTNNKLTEERRLVQKWKEVEILEERLQEEKKQLKSEKELTEKIKQELKIKQNLFTEMELIGYPVLKQRSESLEGRIIELEKEIQQQTLINQHDKQKIDNLLKQSMQPSFEQAVVANELERSRETFKREKSILEQQKESLEKRLVEEIRQRKLLVEQYSEQRDMVESLTRKLSDVNELSYKGRFSNMHSTRSQPHTAGRSPDISPRKKGHHNGNESSRYNSNIDYETQNADYWEDTRQRLMNLDEETEMLNKAYQEFRNRLGNNVSPLGDSHQNQWQLEFNCPPFNEGLKEGRLLSRFPVQSQSLGKLDTCIESNTTDIDVNSQDNRNGNGNEFRTHFNEHPLMTQPQHHHGLHNQHGFHSANASSNILNKMVSDEDDDDDDDSNDDNINLKLQPHQYQPITSDNRTSASPLKDSAETDYHINQPKDDLNNSQSHSLIQLDNRWRSTNENEDQNKVNLASKHNIAQQNQIVHTDNPNNAEVNDRDGGDDDEDEDIDPVLKNFMQLVKEKRMKGESTQLSSDFVDDNQRHVSKEDTKPIEEDIEEDIETESLQISGNADINKIQDNSKSSEADDSFF